MVPFPTSSRLMSYVPPPRSNTNTTWWNGGKGRGVGTKRESEGRGGEEKAVPDGCVEGGFSTRTKPWTRHSHRDYTAHSERGPQSAAPVSAHQCDGLGPPLVSGRASRPARPRIGPSQNAHGSHRLHRPILKCPRITPLTHKVQARHAPSALCHPIPRTTPSRKIQSLTRLDRMHTHTEQHTLMRKHTHTHSCARARMQKHINTTHAHTHTFPHTRPL
jgi:hypothetical protein